MTTHRIAAEELVNWISLLLQAHGSSAQDAWRCADSLVSADLEGVSSHGVMLLPMYLDRIRAGSIDLRSQATVEQDLGGLVVMDGHRQLGQVTSQTAVELVIDRAQKHGVALVTVRNGFHFGAAAYWTRQMAAAGCVGAALSNTRPLMPAPGGAERVVGNNPLSLAFPSADGQPLVVDMAMSATAMGKIRLAHSRSQPIPEGWATDAQGQPTTSAQEAIQGMLLPAAGPKGFGLAVAIDLLCGALSGGGVGSAVQPLYGDPSIPYNCSHTFLAIDTSRSGGVPEMTQLLAEQIRHSRPSVADARLYAPGDVERERRTTSAGYCLLDAALVDRLRQEGQRCQLTHSLGDRSGGPSDGAAAAP